MTSACLPHELGNEAPALGRRVAFTRCSETQDIEACTFTDARFASGAEASVSPTRLRPRKSLRSRFQNGASSMTQRGSRSKSFIAMGVLTPARSELSCRVRAPDIRYPVSFNV